MNRKFLRRVWRYQEPRAGNYFCLATLHPKTKRWEDYFLKWPISDADLDKFDRKFPADEYNIYFCPTPFHQPQRKKSFVIGSKLLWSDLDDVHPRDCDPKPQIAWKSSDQRFAALWILNRFYDSATIEQRCKALAYNVGADKGGWDLTQVLRLPGTINHKYEHKPSVRQLWFKTNEYSINEMPKHVYQKLDPSELLKEYKKKIKPSTLKLLTAKYPTQGKRSEVIWRINNDLAEQGFDAHIRFNLLKASVWNKFAGRDDEEVQLMREVEKVEASGKLSKAVEDKDDDGPTVIRMSKIEAEEVQWLWYPYIPLGKVTLLEGDPGLGKSWLTMSLASYISDRKKLPGAKERLQGKVLLMSAEDGLGDTIRPRLDALEADVGKVYAYAKPVYLDEDGMSEVEEQIEMLKPLLVIIDPIVAYMGSKVDLFRANETREIMSGLGRLAERHQCAIVAVRHLTKGGKDKSIYRGVGSIDITAAARSALMVGPHPEEANHRCVCHIKSNLAPKGQTIEYSLTPDRRNPFRWEGFNDFTAEDIMKANPETLNSQNLEQEAEQFLSSALSNKSMKQDILYRDAAAAGISEKMLRKVADRLGVKKFKSNGGYKWLIT